MITRLEQKNELGTSFAPTNDNQSSTQLGHEKTPFEYVRRLCDTFDDPDNVLELNGSLFMVVGDTFARRTFVDPSGVYPSIMERESIGIQHIIVFEMRRRKYRLWQEIVWSKPSVPPSGAAQQRCNPCHEYILWFVRQDCTRPKFYPRAVRELGKTPAGRIMPPVGGRKYGDYEKTIVSDGNRCRRDVWEMCPSRDKSSHVAPFPEDLVEVAVSGCTDEGDLVVDPFGGTLTVERVCKRLNRSSLCYDLFDHRPQNNDVSNTGSSSTTSSSLHSSSSSPSSSSSSS